MKIKSNYRHSLIAAACVVLAAGQARATEYSVPTGEMPSSVVRYSGEPQYASPGTVYAYDSTAEGTGAGADTAVRKQNVSQETESSPATSVKATLRVKGTSAQYTKGNWTTNLNWSNDDNCWLDPSGNVIVIGDNTDVYIISPGYGYGYPYGYPVYGYPYNYNYGYGYGYPYNYGYGYDYYYGNNYYYSGNTYYRPRDNRDYSKYPPGFGAHIPRNETSGNGNWNRNRNRDNERVSLNRQYIRSLPQDNSSSGSSNGYSGNRGDVHAYSGGVVRNRR